MAVGRDGGTRKPWAAIAIAGLVTAAVAAAPPPRQDQPAREEREIPPVEAPRPDGGPVPVPDSAAPPVVLPPATRTTPGGGIAVVPAGAVGGVPALVYAAYRRAAAASSVTMPGCHLPVSLLAAIGKVESGHARGGRVDGAGTTPHPILGPTLDGSPGLAAIADTDGGHFDGDTRWDRAVGPMQFIPGTWRRWATDGNGDGDASPHNVFDASGAAGRYLCAGGRDLATGAALDAAILSYNNSASYLRIVRTWMAVYEKGAIVVPGFTDLPDPVVPVTGPGTPTTPTTPAPPGAPDPTTPPVTTPAPPPSGTPTEPTEPGEPEPEPPATTPPAPAPAPGDVLTGTVGGLVGGVVCVVDGVLDGATGLLGGLLGAPVTQASGETCP
ncbi:lytic transglycosylase domain-containing protein [Actinophytocola sp. KF-1]